MESVQEFYNQTVSHRTSDEQLQLASMILNKLLEQLLICGRSVIHGIVDFTR